MTQLRALTLSALMILSVFAGAIALPGTAGAANTPNGDTSVTGNVSFVNQGIATTSSSNATARIPAVQFDANVTLNTTEQDAISLTNDDTAAEIQVQPNETVAVPNGSTLLVRPYGPDGTVQSPEFAVVTDQGIEGTFNATVSGDTSAIQEPISNFTASYIDNGTSVSTTPEIEPHPVNYTGQISQNSTSGSIEFSLPRNGLLSGDAELRFRNTSTRKSMTYSASTGNYTATVDAANASDEAGVFLSDGSGALYFRVLDTVNVSTQSGGTQNATPNASFSASPTEPNVNETVRLNASESSDSDGFIASYEWDLDADGQYDDATGMTANTSYSSTGTRSISLRVTDNESATDTADKVITVQRTFNVTNFSAPSEVLVGDTITVNATVTNSGNSNETTEVEYAFNGTTVLTQNVTLGPGNSTTVRFNASTGNLAEKTYTHGIRAGTDLSTARITVREFVQVVGADASGFTTIRTFVNVNSTAGRNGNLTARNFTVRENGVKQTIDSVQFTQNETQTNLDIVYVFDRTGSMSDEIDDLRSQVKNVSRQLNQSGRDVRFALVTYNSNIRTTQNLTRNVTKLETALDNVSTGGGTELAYDAIDEGLQQRFRGDSQKVVVTITDEEVNRNSDSPNITQMERRLQQNGVNFVAISPERSQLSSQDPELDLRELANRSGGVWYDIEGANFTDIINDVTGRLSTTYIVTYDTTNQLQGSNTRTVNVTVQDPSGARDSDLGVYIPPQVDITDINTSDFPRVNVTVSINTTEAKNGTLVADNFSISEDNTQRSIDSFKFDSQNKTYIIGYTTPDPAENGTVRDIELVANLSSGSSVPVTGDYKAPGTSSNRLPNVTFSTSPTNPEVGETITLNASNSTDPDGSVVSYRWDLDGDGNYDDATGVTVTTSYNSTGNQQIGLLIEDDGGATNTTTKVVSVGDTETIASDGQPGLGAGIAIIALLLISLIAHYRRT